MEKIEFDHGRRFLIKAALFGAGSVALSGCREVLSLIPKEELPETPKIPTETPTPWPIKTREPLTPTSEVVKYLVSGQNNLIDIAEKIKVPAVDGDDYYPWYRWNGEKLFDPYNIPYGTQLIIPDSEKEPPKLPEIVSSPEGWRYFYGSSETSLAGSSENRRKNVRRGVELINNQIIEPYKLFSVNKALGSITAENGFVEGFGYLDEREVPMMGGGVCQIPSTLFKTALDSGMLVPQRFAHEFYSDRYLPGFDATISDSFDLTIRNLCDFPFQIRALIDKGKDTLKIVVCADRPVAYQEIKVETIMNNEIWNDDKIHARVRQTVKLTDSRIRVKDYDSQYSQR